MVLSGMPSSSPQIDVRRAHDRAHTRIGWLDSKHSFSFGRHYDPTNTGHGLLLVNNDDIVRSGSGFDTHPHRDMEIVTWVLSGELEHKDSEHNRGVLYPGLAQRMSAGTGIWHSEMNNSGTADLEGAGTLSTGDAVRLTAAGSPTLIAGPEGAEVLIWATA